jgi:hypothetical protein
MRKPSMTSTTSPTQSADEQLPDVRPQQVWADNDARSAGRTLRVDAIDGQQAVCTVLTTAAGAIGTPGRSVRIAVRRFRPTSTGYRLLTDSPAQP